MVSTGIQGYPMLSGIQGYGIQSRSNLMLKRVFAALEEEEKEVVVVQNDCGRALGWVQTEHLP
jgi:hypothetical protein